MKLLKAIILLLIINQVFIFALPDSLWNNIKSLPDTTKIDKLSDLAWSYRYKDPILGAQCGHQAIDIAAKLQDFNRLAKNKNILGIIYLYQGDFINSQRYIRSALDFAREVNNLMEIGYSFNNFGSLQSFQNNHAEALVNYKYALSYMLQTKDDKAIAYAYIRMSDAYRELGRFDSSIAAANMAYDYRINARDTVDAQRALLNVGLAYESMKNYPKAIEMFLRVQNFIYDPGRIETFLGRAHYELGNYKRAIFYAEKALTLINKMYANIRINYEVLFKSYEKLGNFKNAYSYLKKQNELLTTLDKEDQKKQLEFLKFAYNYDYAKDENLRLTLETKEKDEQLIYLFLGLSILLIFSILLVLFIVKFRKNNKLLNEKNLLIIESSRELEKLNATKDKFFSIIAHDLRNPIGSFKTAFQFIKDNYVEFSKDEIKEFVDSMSETSNNVYELLDNLLEWSKIQRSSIKYESKIIDLSEIINDNIKLFANNAALKKINLSNKVKLGSFVNSDYNMLKTIFRNLISNSIKFTKAGGSIKIYENWSSEILIELVVEDNGVGMSKEVMDGLFQIDKNVSSFGTNNERGTGLGLILCKEFIDLIGGKISVESEINSYSKFYIQLPR